MRRAFTVEQANALIPELEGTLQQIEDRKAGLLRTFDRIQVLDLLWGRKLRDPDNPDHEEAKRLRRAMEKDFEGIDQIVKHQIVGRGMRFPEGALEHGLVDFPSTYEGRWVYLCWQRGEPSVEAWHEVDAGYAGRRALTPEQAPLMGRDDPHTIDDSVLDW